MNDPFGVSEAGFVAAVIVGGAVAFTEGPVVNGFLGFAVEFIVSEGTV